MRVLVCEELINDLRVNIDKIEDMARKLDRNNYEAFFVYSFALFESGICEAIRRLLAAFPEKLSDDKQPRIRYSDVFSNLFSPNHLLYTIINAEIKSISKGNALVLLEEAQRLMAIKLTFDRSTMEEVSEYRNRLVHDNTVSNGEYILGAGHSKSKNPPFHRIKILIDILADILKELELSLGTKYQKYTKFKLIKDLWGEVFNTPLLRFEDCVAIRRDTFEKHVVVVNMEHLISRTKSISSSERFFLALLLQQYSGGLNDILFKFRDIPGLVSITSKDKIHKILHVFDIYPNLLNGVHIDGVIELNIRGDADMSTSQSP